jgi:hypothetical protein
MSLNEFHTKSQTNQKDQIGLSASGLLLAGNIASWLKWQSALAGYEHTL